MTNGDFNFIVNFFKSTQVMLDYGTASDVAGVEEQLGGMSYDVGLYTYISNIGDTYYAEYDPFFVPSINTSLIITGGSLPRIDAPDANTLNNGSNHYDIVTNAGGIIYDYNPGNGTQEICSGAFSPTVSAEPVIAWAPTGYYTLDYYNSYGGTNNIYAQQVVDAIPYSLFNTYYYQVNMSSDASISAITKTCNTLYSNGVFVCWYNATNSDIEYKRTGTAPPSFKPTGVKQNMVINMISAYPDPTSDVLNLKLPDNLHADNYTVTDVGGHTVLTGTICGQTQAINVSGLAYGLYLVNINTNEGNKQVKFAKD